MNPRDVILETVRARLGRGSMAAPPAPPPVPILGRVDLPIAERVELFAQRLEAVGGVCHRGDPARSIADVLARHRAQTIATSDADAVLRLRDDPALAGHRWLPPDCPQAELFAAGVGITAAQWAIADTGSIVLESACERSRLASLVPPVHIALVPASRILCDLGEALKTLGRPLSPAVTLITGPSRTADIELQLVLGVHGPRELHVVLV